MRSRLLSDGILGFVHRGGLMSLLVEDGSMPAEANSYVSLEAADAYLVPRGLWEATPIVVTPGENGAPDMEDPDAGVVSKKEAALIRAFDALNTLKWRGDAADWQRVTAWPRVGVSMPGNPKLILPADCVPLAVGQAQMELAGLIYGGLNPLAPMERGGKVISRSESTKEGDIDVIGGDAKSYSVTYADSAPVESYLPSVYGILRPWLAEIPGQSAGLLCADVLRG